MGVGTAAKSTADQFQQPVLEQRGDRLRQPLAEPQVAHPVAGTGRMEPAYARRGPVDWGRQRRHRARLQDIQLATGERPLDVLWPVKIRGRRASDIRYRGRLV